MLITNSRTCFEKIAGFSSDAYPLHKDAISRIGKYLLTVENTFLTERAFSTMAMRFSVQVFPLFPFQMFTIAIHRSGFSLRHSQVRFRDGECFAVFLDLSGARARGRVVLSKRKQFLTQHKTFVVALFKSTLIRSKHELTSS